MFQYLALAVLVAHCNISQFDHIEMERLSNIAAI